MNRETMGYNVCMYGSNGGCISFWCESLEDATHELMSFTTDGDNKTGITLVKTPYKKRMSRFVITKPKGLRDSGIFSKITVKEKDSGGNP